MSLKKQIKNNVPWVVHYMYRKVYYAPKDLSAAYNFIFNSTKSPTTFGQRLGLVRKFYKISYKVTCPHTEHEFIYLAKKILDLGPGVKGDIVEAGAFHGGSTSKLSLVAKLCNRKLMVFDSFEGMPENNEVHGKSIFGREHHFPKGSHTVSFDSVKKNVETYGDISRCQFFKGWFSVTMPDFKGPVSVVCINADLAQSTKDCLKYMFPLMQAGGLIFSQDGHFPWIIDLLKDEAYWKNELHITKPEMEGLGTSKLVTIICDTAVKTI